MIQKEIAKILNGVEINEELENKQDRRYAKENDCVIVFGASDDLMELRGALYDEIDCYEGCTVWISKSGVLKNKCDDEYCPYFARMKDGAKHFITALWWEEGEYSWTYKTNIPNIETFNVMEEGNYYCRGIAFDLRDLSNEVGKK